MVWWILFCFCVNVELWYIVLLYLILVRYNFGLFGWIIFRFMWYVDILIWGWSFYFFFCSVLVMVILKGDLKFFNELCIVVLRVDVLCFVYFRKCLRFVIVWVWVLERLMCLGGMVEKIIILDWVWVIVMLRWCLSLVLLSGLKFIVICLVLFGL